MSIMFNVGDMVVIESRTWPGINKHGGVAKVLKVDEKDGTVDVKYTLGGSEKKVEFMYAKLWDVYSSSSAAAARRSGTAPATVAFRNSKRSIVSNRREIPSPISRNDYRSSNKKPTKIATKMKPSHSLSCLQPNKGCTNLTLLTIPRKLKRLPLSESNHHQVIDTQLPTRQEERMENDTSKKPKLAKTATVATSTTTSSMSPQSIILPHDDTTNINDEKENRLEIPSSCEESIITLSCGTEGVAPDASTEPKTALQTVPIKAITSRETKLEQQPTVLLPTRSVVPSSKLTVSTDNGGGYPSMPQSPLPPKKRMLLRTTLEQQQQQQRQQNETLYSLSHVPPANMLKSNSPKDSDTNAAAQFSELTPVIRPEEKYSTTSLSTIPQLGRKNSMQDGILKTSIVTTSEIDTQSVASNTITGCDTINAPRSRSTPWKKRHHVLSTSLVTPSPKDEGIRNDHNHNNRSFTMQITTENCKENTNSNASRGTLWKKRHHLLSTSFVTPSPKAEVKNETNSYSIQDLSYNKISTKTVSSHTTIGTNSQGRSTPWTKRHPAFLVPKSFGTPSHSCYYH